MKPLPIDRFLECLDYCPESGVLTRKTGQYVGQSAKKVVGGYLRLKVDGECYAAHRVAWSMFYGKEPEHEIDHINGDRKDNRISNLRDVTPALNSQNCRKPRPGSLTKVLGVRKNRVGRYEARIKIDGRGVHIGTFDTADQAHSAYVLEKRRAHPGSTL